MTRRMTEPPTTPGGDHPDPHPKSGNTTMVQGETQERVPRMPHERDESADQQASTEPSNRRVGEQAHADARRGVADTTRGAEADATYEKLRKERPASGGKPRP
ncbi:hypothetical protein [Ramlibacter sp.]|uniref:hypothetical protein n=1 Tax=Ramlibacter sp. TaxID=1917967 RepID=UPI002D57BCE0|nr:hypothetical protein [Ramlibacter sp.]HYD76717.1 hypothetical protein [Ramlibacter sp.]